MGCTIGFTQNTLTPPSDSNSSFSCDDLQENEVSLDQIHQEIAFIKINVKKQKEIYPDDNITEVKHWIKCHYNTSGTSNKSDTNSKKSCLKQQTLTTPLSLCGYPKKVHFLEVQKNMRNSNSQNVKKKKKSKKRRSRRSEELQKPINLDDIF